MSTHEFRCIRFQRHAGTTPGADVLEVVIDRPDSPLNAVNGVLHEDLTQLFPRLQAEREETLRRTVKTRFEIDGGLRSETS